MAYLAARHSSYTNGVARLHGDVTRKMAQPMWAGYPLDEVPIGSVTNGDPHAVVDLDGDERPAQSLPRAAMGREARRHRSLAARRSHSGSGTVAGPPDPPRAAGPLRAHPAGLPGAAARRHRRRDHGSRRRPLPRRPDHRVRAPLRHLQASHAAAARRRAAETHSHRLANGRCRSCLPARPIRTTPKARN